MLEILAKSVLIYEYIIIFTEIVKNRRKGMQVLVGIDLYELRLTDCLGNHCL